VLPFDKMLNTLPDALMNANTNDWMVREVKEQGGMMKGVKSVYGDPEYVRQRDKLIPRAEEICDKRLGVTKKDGRGAEWSRLFMVTMDRLWLLESLKEKQARMSSELSRISFRLAEAEMVELAEAV
jgi:hypothetical protein